MNENQPANDTQQIQIGQVRTGLENLKPIIREKFEEIDGACDYFYELENKMSRFRSRKLTNKLEMAKHPQTMPMIPPTTI